MELSRWRHSLGTDNLHGSTQKIKSFVENEESWENLKLASVFFKIDFQMSTCRALSEGAQEKVLAKM